MILRCLLSTLKIQFEEDILIAGQQSLMMLLERIDSLFRDNQGITRFCQNMIDFQYTFGPSFMPQLFFSALPFLSFTIPSESTTIFMLFG